MTTFETLSLIFGGATAAAAVYPMFRRRVRAWRTGKFNKDDGSSRE